MPTTSVQARVKSSANRADEHKRQANVRFDAMTRSALEDLATTSDRTLSQLVRYAVAWWLAEGGFTCPTAPEGDSQGRHVNVKFDAALLVGLNRRQEQTGSDRSTLIRCAVRSWIRHVHASGQDSPLGFVPAQPVRAAV